MADAVKLGAPAGASRARRSFMQLQLTNEETVVLKTTLDRAIHQMERELVRTDAPSLQHALNKDFERLRALRQRLDKGTPS
jgi:hypothetical protein